MSTDWFWWPVTIVAQQHWWDITGNDRKRKPILLTIKVCQTFCVGVESLSGVIFLSGWLKRGCTLADDLIKSPSLKLKTKGWVCQLLFLFKDGSFFITSPGFLISASHIPYVSSRAECQQCHNSHDVVVEIPALPAANNMYSTLKPDCRFGTLFGR